MAHALTVLLVEDNPADQRLALEAFKGGKWEVTPRVVEDGEQALAYLHREGKFAGVARPDLILLDLNLPGIDGREVLQRVKADPELRQIPVVILTTSHSEEDVKRCYGLAANSYVIKPTDLDEFFVVMDSVQRYWFETVAMAGGG